MKTKQVILSILLISLVGFLKWTQLTMVKFERDVEMAKLALMGEFKVDSVERGGFTSGDRYTVAKVEDHASGEIPKLRLSDRTTKWLREHPKADGRKGFPVGTVPRPSEGRPSYVEFDVVVWKLVPSFSADGEVSYRALQYARRMTTSRDHPWAVR